MLLKKKIALLIGFLNKIYYFPKRSQIKIGKNFSTNHLVQINGKGKVTIGDNCNFVSHSQKVAIHTYSPDAIIKIGNNCRLNSSILQSQTAITLDSYVMAGSCHVIDTNFHSISAQDRRIDIDQNIKQNITTKSIYIGSDVWIGGEAIVLKGVELQDGCVVGIRSVVTKSFPSKSIIAGNPAKLVKIAT